MYINLFATKTAGEQFSIHRNLTCIGTAFCPLSFLVTREEHQAILSFIGETVGGNLSPIDVEADAIIRAYFKRNPDAAYRMTKLAMALAAQARQDQTCPTATARQKRHRHWLTTLFARSSAIS